MGVRNLRIRFIKRFILFVNTTSLDDVGNLIREEKQFHIQFGKLYDILEWDNKGSISDIKFCPNGPMNGGITTDLNNEYFEILNASVGTKGKVSDCGCSH